MKYVIVSKTISCLVAIMLIVVSCALIKSKRENNRQRDCMALCTAIEAAKCWDNPTLMDGLKSAADLSSCINGCNDNYTLITSIDFSCLSASKGCELIEECVEFEVPNE